MGIASLRRAQEPNRAAPVRKPDFIRYAEHTRIVQELTREYELKLLALKAPAAEADPEPEAKRKPGRPRKA